MPARPADRNAAADAITAPVNRCPIDPGGGTPMRHRIGAVHRTAATAR